MESGFKPEDAKEVDNTALNLALAICFSGLFLMIVGLAAAAAVLVFGSAPILANLTYLVAVAFYLGLVVVAMVGAASSFTIPAPEIRTRIKPRRSVAYRRLAQDRQLPFR